MNDAVCASLERHFDTAFAAPDGIKKLRELILTLAMQGKLVAQNPNDPPASQLLKEIEAEKKRLVKEGKIKAPKPLPEIKPEEVPYALPQGWEWVRLGDICEYNGRDNVAPESIASDAWLLDLEDIEKDTSRLIYRAKYSERQSKSTKSTFQKGDVLYGKLRPYLDKVIVADADGVCTTEIVPIVPSKAINSDFLRLLLKRPAFLSHVNSLMYGVKMPRLGTEDAVQSIHPLPPLSEQHRIVAKIDQLMARCDELEKLRDERELKRRSVHAAALKQLLDAQASDSFADAWQFITHHFGELYAVRENVTELRKAILQLGVQGKLAAREGKSSTWERRFLKDLATKIGSGSTPSGGKDSYQESGVPLIRSMNVHFGGFVHSGLVFLSDVQAEKLKNVSVKPNDVLLNITGASIGRVAIAPEEMADARVNQHVCIIRPTSEITPKFLEAFLASPIVQNMIDDVQVGATREALTKSMIERFEILLPPIEEQHRIVTKIDSLMAMCDTLEQQIDAAASKQTALLDAVMAEV
jgi:type I restriction enzyme S subunit